MGCYFPSAILPFLPVCLFFPSFLPSYHAFPRTFCLHSFLFHFFLFHSSLFMSPVSVCFTRHGHTGERRKRQQAATLGVSPTLVARPHVSARSLAQQQVLAQHQQQGSAAAVAQRAAAEKLQMEQRALERDYEQLRRDQLRCAHITLWAESKLGRLCWLQALNERQQLLLREEQC